MEEGRVETLCKELWFVGSDRNDLDTKEDVCIQLRVWAGCVVSLMRVKSLESPAVLNHQHMSCDACQGCKKHKGRLGKLGTQIALATLLDESYIH